jgi:hypothetical protein
MTPWNYDLTQAPTDGQPIWAACPDGKVYKTWWLPPSGKLRPVGRWCNLGPKEIPIAWMLFVVPIHPFAQVAA